MSRIWAVARHMIAEGIRMKSALVFIVVIVILLTVIPLTVEGDGVTIKSRAQSFLSYSLGSVGFLLSVLTVFMACGSLANEISQKHVFMITSKPIPRWQFFAGKWLGISTLNAIMLLVTGVTVWCFSQFYMKTRPAPEADLQALQGEVLTVRSAAHPEKPDFAALVKERIRILREEDRLDESGMVGQDQVVIRIYNELDRAWKTLGPGQSKEFVFRDLLVNRDEPGNIYLHFKPRSSAGVDYIMFDVLWQCGDSEDVDTLTNVQKSEFPVDRFHTIEIPKRAVNKEGALYVRMKNIDPRDGIVFEGDDSFEVLYHIGTFHWNLIRALSIIWCRLAFLAALGLLASTFLSFPVACMVTFLVLLVATGSGFLSEAMETIDLLEMDKDPVVEVAKFIGIKAEGVMTRFILTIVAWFVRLLMWVVKGFIWIVPDFSAFDPVGTVVSGRVVTLIWVMTSFTTLVLIKGAILGVLGCVVFTKRELAQVVA